MARPLFGEVAVTLGYLTREQLENALSIQERQDREREPHQPLGVICIELGYLNPRQVREVVDRQSVVPGLLHFMDGSSEALRT